MVEKDNELYIVCSLESDDYVYKNNPFISNVLFSSQYSKGDIGKEECDPRKEVVGRLEDISLDDCPDYSGNSFNKTIYHHFMPIVGTASLDPDPVKVQRLRDLSNLVKKGDLTLNETVKLVCEIVGVSEQRVKSVYPFLMENLESVLFDHALLGMEYVEANLYHLKTEDDEGERKSSFFIASKTEEDFRIEDDQLHLIMGRSLGNDSPIEINLMENYGVRDGERDELREMKFFVKHILFMHSRMNSFQNRLSHYHLEKSSRISLKKVGFVNTPRRFLMVEGMYRDNSGKDWIWPGLHPLVYFTKSEN